MQELSSRWGLAFQRVRQLPGLHEMAKRVDPTTGEILATVFLDDQNRIHGLACAATWNDHGRQFLYACLALLPNVDASAARSWIQATVSFTVRPCDATRQSAGLALHLVCAPDGTVSGEYLMSGSGA